MRYAVVPGCVATGDTVAAVESKICDTIRFHSLVKKMDRRSGPAMRTLPVKQSGNDSIAHFAASTSPLKFELCAERLSETFMP